MRLILIPDDTSSGNSYSLSSMQVKLVAVVSLILLGLLFAVASLSGIWAFSSSQLAATASANTVRLVPSNDAMPVADIAQPAVAHKPTPVVENVATDTAVLAPVNAAPAALAIVESDTTATATATAMAKTMAADDAANVSVQPLMPKLSRPEHDVSETKVAQTKFAEVAHPGEQTIEQRTLPGRLNQALSKVIAVAKGGRDDPSEVKVDPKVLSEIEQLRKQLGEQARQLALLRASANSTINDLGVRVGSLQAHMTRLNALGHRLTQGANLTDGEFNFDAEPAVGGSASVTQVQAQNAAQHAGAASGAQTPSTPTAATTDMAPSAPNLQNQLQQLEQQMRQSNSQLAVLEVLLRGRRLERQSQPVGWPAAAGWVSSDFGERQDPFTGVRSFHKGIDIAAGIGTGVLAAASGLVVYAGPQGDLGHVVEISHGSGYTTRYAHNSEILVKKGDFVVKGERIAAMGSSGRSTGSHLHFEVFEAGEAVDPKKYLESQ